MVEAKIDPEKKVLIFIMLLALVGSVIGTYAYFSSRSNSGEQTVTTGKLELKFGDNNPIINNQNIIPIEEKDIQTKATKKTFTLKNSSTSEITAKIEFTNITITEALKSEDFKWALFEDSTKITEGNFKSLGTDNHLTLKDTIKIGVDVTKTYNLYIWINETGVAQNELQDGSLTATISANGVQ